MLDCQYDIIVSIYFPLINGPSKNGSWTGGSSLPSSVPVDNYRAHSSSPLQLISHDGGVNAPHIKYNICNSLWFLTTISTPGNRWRRCLETFAAIICTIKFPIPEFAARLDTWGS
ncbi:hypothetical protein D5086_025507 [Populus alba]|uniref:Uncharacterized protein n=1 Tax=Populus alba TaxID=43335 RepID=A0ACC4AZF4_POPAL